MPLFDFFCYSCQNSVTDYLMKHTDDRSLWPRCMPCGLIMERSVSKASVQFKGSGWYESDYKEKT